MTYRHRCITFLPVLAVTLLASGCAGERERRADRETTPTAAEPDAVLVVSSPAEIPTIPEQQTHRFSQLEPGMSVSRFRQLFPEAYFVHRRRVAWSDEPIDAYEIQRRQRYRFPESAQVYVQPQRIWFYFVEGGLESWGSAEEWPREPR